MWQGVITGILGIWGIISAFLITARTGNFWNDLIVGIVVVIMGFAMVGKRRWQGWTAIILGIWWVIAGFIQGLTTGTGNRINDLVVGIIVAIAGFAALGKAATS